MSLKDMFWKDTGPKEAPASREGAIVAKNISIGMQAIGGLGTPIQVDATSGSEFDQYLNKLMDDANLPGPDYYEFSKALGTLKASSLTEEQKYITIFAGFGAQGVTAQSLVDAAQKYIAILGQKKSNEFDASVQSAEGNLKSIKNQMADLGDQNAKLQQQLVDNAKKLGELTQEYSSKETKLEVKKTTFNMSYQNFINKIMADIGNITKYLINGQSTK